MATRTINVPVITHEEAVANIRRLVAEKKQALAEPPSPEVLEALARLREKNERRGTPIVKV